MLAIERARRPYIRDSVPVPEQKGDGDERAITKLAKNGTKLMAWTSFTFSQTQLCSPRTAAQISQKTSSLEHSTPLRERRLILVTLAMRNSKSSDKTGLLMWFATAPLP